MRVIIDDEQMNRRTEEQGTDEQEYRTMNRRLLEVIII